MINLSSKTLSDACVAALSKGLSFVPSTHCRDFDTIVDFHKFFCTLRLKEFFSGQDRPLTHSSRSASGDTRETTGREDVTSTALSARPRMPFKGRSTFIPPPNRNASIDTYCRLMENDVSLLLQDSDYPQRG